MHRRLLLAPEFMLDMPYVTFNNQSAQTKIKQPFRIEPRVEFCSAGSIKSRSVLFSMQVCFDSTVRRFSALKLRG